MHEQKTPPATIALAWIIVAVPMLWAIWQTLIKVIELFR
ncbi:MFS transporter small subunit [Deinococcus taeanensis]